MNARAWRATKAATAALALATTVAIAFALFPVPTPARAGAVAYVALGDSYAAGPGIPFQTDAACLRSADNYPSQLAVALAPTSLRDASCSGATTQDLAHPQTGAGGTVVAPQLDALAPATTLVTLTIGGNDIGFAGVALTCAQLALTDLLGAPCSAHYTSGGTDQLAAAIDATVPKVAGALAAIHQRSPLARILVVGYPDLLPLSGPGCWPIVPLAAGDVAYLRGVEVQLNAMLATQAASSGATFVDTYGPSIGHDACTLPGTKWVEGVLPLAPAYPLHPNSAGMQGDSADVLGALGDG